MLNVNESDTDFLCIYVHLCAHRNIQNIFIYGLSRDSGNSMHFILFYYHPILVNDYGENSRFSITICHSFKISCYTNLKQCPVLQGVFTYFKITQLILKVCRFYYITILCLWDLACQSTIRRNTLIDDLGPEGGSAWKSTCSARLTIWVQSLGPRREGRSEQTLHAAQSRFSPVASLERQLSGTWSSLDLTWKLQFYSCRSSCSNTLSSWLKISE